MSSTAGNHLNHCYCKGCVTKKGPPSAPLSKEKIRQSPCVNRKILRKIIILAKAGERQSAGKLAAVTFVRSALNNHRPLVKALLKIGVDIDGSFNSYPPLCLVVKNNNLAMVCYLLSLGASPNVEMDRRSVLVLALDNQNPEMAELLLKAGADPNQFNHATPLKWTILTDRIATGDLETIKLLVRYGADIQASSRSPYPGWSPLFEAVKHERPEIVEYLLKAGADPTYHNRNGITAQRLAGRTGNKVLIRLIRDAVEEAMKKNTPYV